MNVRHPRIHCIVPFCGCGATRFPPGMEFICQKHYALVDRALKARRRRLRRLYRRRGLADTARARTSDAVIWRRMVAQAIARAAGG